MITVDFHTHILPGIDDGSKDEGMTKAMLIEEKRQGVVKIIATPHFYADQMSVDGFLNHRSAALDKTERIRMEAEEPLPEIIAGAEVYYFSGIGLAAEIPKLCIGDTDVLLLERYYRFQKNRDVWNRILTLPLHTQINAASFVNKGRFLRPDRKWQFSIDFLKKHPDTLHIGSDCHNMTTRIPNLASGRDAIAASLGHEALKRIDASTAVLLGL